MEEIKVHGIYRHFKGDYYLVEGIAKKCGRFTAVCRKSRFVWRRRTMDSPGRRFFRKSES